MAYIDTQALPGEFREIGVDPKAPASCSGTKIGFGFRFISVAGVREYEELPLSELAESP